MTPLIRNANRPQDHFGSFAIPFAAIRFGDGEDAISDIQDRLGMEGRGGGKAVMYMGWGEAFGFVSVSMSVSELFNLEESNLRMFYMTNKL